MKTIKDKAFELYPDVSFKKDVASEDKFRMNEVRFLERVAFEAGYNEAIRWTPLVVEKPKYYKKVLIKVMELGGEDYRIAFLRKYEDTEVFFTEYNTFIYTKDVIGWRPIEP